MGYDVDNQEKDKRMRTVSNRQTGSFYTTGIIAEYMSNWAIRNASDVLLEPSFGDGIFIDKAAERFYEIGNKSPEIYAVELQETTYSAYISKTNIPLKASLNDFLAYELSTGVDAVIGNPPYVSLKNLEDNYKENAVKIVKSHKMNISMNGSLWFPFVIHATALLKPGGRLAFVMPYEVAYVRYAFKLWEFLGNNYSGITLVRLYEDFFPDVDVETILLFVEGKGGRTDSVEYCVYDTISDLHSSSPQICKQILISDIVNNRKPFTSALLNSDQESVLTTLRQTGDVEPIINSIKSKIGYVCADKAFFHPTEETRRKFELPASSFIPTIVNSREINGGTGIGLSVGLGECRSLLYAPIDKTLVDDAYIDYGERIGVSNRYKCRQRNPWYITPYIEYPDIILSVFGDVLKMIINEGRYAISNSLLGGSLSAGTSPKGIICRWYNSLTLLSVEMNVHSLGGGSLVLIPGEADSLEIVKSLPDDKVDTIYEELNRCVLSDGTEAAYRLGDKLVLSDILGLCDDSIRSIQNGVALLKNWRQPRNRRSL
jgi:hypothetical protein